MNNVNLEKFADAGSCFATETLGKRLFDAGAADTGLELLRRAVAAGSLAALHSLGIRLIDHGGTSEWEQEGWQFLECAAENGSLRAMTELGIRLCCGEGRQMNVLAGTAWLRRSSRMGDQFAGIMLHIFMTAQRHDGNGDRPAFAGQHDQLAFLMYREALSADTTHIRQRFTKQSVHLLYEGHLTGDIHCSCNLAYLIRRGEVDGTGFPSLDELLEPALRERDAYALVNQSLRLAAGIQGAADWNTADSLISGLRSSTEVLEWWRSLLDAGDPEGHLVIGWLVRHGFTRDPAGLSPKERFLLVGDAFKVPAWVN